MSLFKGKATHIAVLQFIVQQDEVQQNLERVTTLIGQARQKGANLICLPATFATGLNFPSLSRTAEALDGPIVDFLKNMARQHKVFIAAGLLECHNKDIYDSAVLIDDGGQLVGHYRRNSLWEGEKDFIAQGTEAVAVDTAIGKIGLLVSYDLRFPEACRPYFNQEVDVIICCAALFARFTFPAPSLVRARAADNSCCFVLASSLGNSRLAMMDYMGRSMIADGLVEDVAAPPDSDILTQAGHREEIIDAVIYPRSRRKQRKDLPYLKDFQRMQSETALAGGCP